MATENFPGSLSAEEIPYRAGVHGSGPMTDSALTEGYGPMRAIMVETNSGPEGLKLRKVPAPEASADKVLIEVHAAGVTYPDVLMSRGAYQSTIPLPFILGSEVAGVVLNAPSGSGLSPGQRVVATMGHGAFAELVSVEVAQVFALPSTVNFEWGAGIPVNLLTADFALRCRGRLQEGETVLVHGAAGGVGSATVRLAKACGARVIATASSQEKRTEARTAGADEVIAVDRFLDSVKAVTRGRGVDMVVDPVGGDRFTDSLRALAPAGRIMVVGFSGGGIPTVKVNRLLLNNISVIGVSYGAFVSGRPNWSQDRWRELYPLLESGAVLARPSAVFDLEDAASAIESLESRTAVGKVVLKVR